MDLKTVVAEVGSWPVEHRLQLVEEIWSGLVEQGVEPEISDDLKALLAARLDALDADPDNVVTWDEIVAHVRRPR